MVRSVIAKVLPFFDIAMFLIGPMRFECGFCFGIPEISRAYGGNRILKFTLFGNGGLRVRYLFNFAFLLSSLMSHSTNHDR